MERRPLRACVAEPAHRALTRLLRHHERLGLDYTYDYRPHYTSQAWEDDFFGYLASIAVAKPVTDYQAAYNAQSGRLDVTGTTGSMHRASRSA